MNYCKVYYLSRRFMLFFFSTTYFECLIYSINQHILTHEMTAELHLKSHCFRVQKQCVQYIFQLVKNSAVNGKLRNWGIIYKNYTSV